MSTYQAVTEVAISRAAERQLRKIPRHIQATLRNWAETVERIGIRSTAC